MISEKLYRGKGNPKYNDGSWCEGSLLFDGTDYQIVDTEYGSTRFTVLPETIGQYTGKTDKNGKKIFGGDILKKDNILMLVFWDKPTFSWAVKIHAVSDFDVIHFESPFFLLWDTDKEDIAKIEVVGNTYDNLDLVKTITEGANVMVVRDKPEDN